MSYIGLAAAVFGADWLLKERAEYKYPPENYPRYTLGGAVRFYRNHNEGFSFGVLENEKEFVSRTAMLFTAFTAGTFARVLTEKDCSGLEKTGYALMTGGAASNLYDRLKRGYVVDYLNFNVKGLEKIVWNLGDLALISGGAALAASAGAESGKPPAVFAAAAELPGYLADGAKKNKKTEKKEKNQKNKQDKQAKKKNIPLTAAVLLWRWHRKRKKRPA